MGGALDEPVGAIILKGFVHPDGSIKGDLLVGAGTARETFGSIHVALTDPTHLRVETQDFVRISQKQIADVPCNTRNPRRIDKEEAWLRGEVYLLFLDYGSADCWFYIGAVQGDARAQNAYAEGIRNAQGVPKDDDEAYFWTQMSAIQGWYKAACCRNADMSFAVQSDSVSVSPPSSYGGDVRNRRSLAISTSPPRRALVSSLREVWPVDLARALLVAGFLAVGQHLRFYFPLLLSLHDRQRMAQPFVLDHSCMRDTLVFVEGPVGKQVAVPPDLHRPVWEVIELDVFACKFFGDRSSFQDDLPAVVGQCELGTQRSAAHGDTGHR